MPKETLKVAATQLVVHQDIEANADKIIANLEQCAADGVEVVLYHEGVLFGYTFDMDFEAAFDQSRIDRAEERIAKKCADLGIAAIVGSTHLEDGERFNSSTVIDQHGEIICRYGKIHLAGEPWCRGGKFLPVVEIFGVQCCFLICHDIRYPELVRLPAAMGAKVCFMANCESSIVHEHKLLAYRSMPISRATENGIYLVMANAPAYKDDPDCSSSSHGNSKIIEPDGNVLVEAGWFTEETVTWDLDLGEAKGHIAWRSYTDDTPLKEWLTDGMKIVEGGSPIGPE